MAAKRTARGITMNQILLNSDKAEMIDWLKENIGSAEKCIIVCARPDARGGLDLITTQLGFRY
jgi:hypothetical protein